MKRVIWNAALAYAGTLEIHARSNRKAHRNRTKLIKATEKLENQAKEIREAVNNDELANSASMASRT